MDFSTQEIKVKTKRLNDFRIEAQNVNHVGFQQVIQ
jgi:hypothetical protein